MISDSAAQHWGNVSSFPPLSWVILHWGYQKDDQPHLFYPDQGLEYLRESWAALLSTAYLIWTVNTVSNGSDQILVIILAPTTMQVIVFLHEAWKHFRQAYLAVVTFSREYRMFCWYKKKRQIEKPSSLDGWSVFSFLTELLNKTLQSFTVGVQVQFTKVDHMCQQKPSVPVASPTFVSFLHLILCFFSSL